MDAASPSTPAGAPPPGLIPPLSDVPGEEILIRAKFPRKFRALLHSTARYKVFYGGRNGAKSWQFARALLARGLGGDLRVLCTREVQSSLKESVKQLLADQINLLGLGAFYRVLEAEIRGPGETRFIFKGLSDPEALKSAEGVDVVWIEEARVVKKASWQKLDHTIRKPGAEIWISFNPELETDFLYGLFVKGPPPPDSIVQKVSYRDNPWLDERIKVQIEHLKATNFDDYLWIYEGTCRAALEGAVYAKELRQAVLDGRITYVPVEKARPVYTFWDLGRGDLTAIWFVQIVGFQYRVVGYYHNNGFLFDHYLAYLETQKEERGWFYGTLWLPHDADHKLLGAARTIRQQAEDVGHKVKIIPHLGAGAVAEGINAARTVFPQCWFDEEHTADGLNCLRAYTYGVDDKTGARTRVPLHNWASHGADAWRGMGVALRDEPVKIKPKPKLRAKVAPGRNSWMAR